MAALPAALTDDLVEEFSLRLPPEDPASLVHAALVCRRWHRILADRGFRGRFCEHHHRRPPMLGFFSQVFGGRTEDIQLSFTPTSSFRLRTAGHADLRFPVDARHGRVLLASKDSISIKDPSTLRLGVWEPVMGDMLELPRMPRHRPGGFKSFFSWHAVVLCASSGTTRTAAVRCLDCQCGPFLVIFVCSSEPPQEMDAYVYSSQDGAWSHTISTVQLQHHHLGILGRSVVAGNAVYFRLLGDCIRIIKYDLSAQEISSVDLPPNYCPNPNGLPQILLMNTESADGLGVAIVDKQRIYLWSREAGPDGLFEWTPTGVIDLETVLHANPPDDFSVVDIVHGLGAIVIRPRGGVISVDIESNRVTKLCDYNDVAYFVPFMSFCTPGTDTTLVITSSCELLIVVDSHNVSVAN